VWEPGPKILKGSAGAPQNGPAGVLPATILGIILGTPVEMLLCWYSNVIDELQEASIEYIIHLTSRQNQQLI
jgi:hypothetical protein